MPSNASIAIELQTTGTAQVLKDMNAVEQATKRLASGAKSQPIDLGLKKQMEEANREALRFQQMNRTLGAQVIGRSIVSSTLSTAMQGSQLAEPVKRAFEMLADIGLQMLAIAGTMKAIETSNVASKALGGAGQQAGNVVSNLSGGATAGAIIAGGLAKQTEKFTSLAHKMEFGGLQAYTITGGGATGPSGSGSYGMKPIPPQSLGIPPTAVPLPQTPVTPAPSRLTTPIPHTGGLGGAAAMTIGIVGATVVLDTVIKRFGELSTTLDDTKKNIKDSGLVVDNLGGTFREFVRGFADSGLFGLGFYKNTPDLSKDKGVSRETVAAKTQAIRGEQATSLLDKAGRELLTLADGSQQWVKSAEDFNKAEIKLALDRKDFQANDFAAAKRLTLATTESYNRQMALINTNRQLQDIQRANTDATLSTLRQQLANAVQLGEWLNLFNKDIVALKKESLIVAFNIADIEREQMAPTKRALENDDFLNQLYGNRGYAGEQARTMERSKTLGEKNLIPQFEAVFQRLLKDTSSVMSTAEKSALAWDTVSKNIAKTQEYGALASALIPDLMKGAGKQASAIAKFQAGVTLNETLRSPTATDEDKRLAKIRYQLDMANANREAIMARGKVEPFAVRADRGSQEAFKVIAGAKAQDATAKGMQELKNINAQMLQVLNVNNAFLNKLVIEAQKVK